MNSPLLWLSAASAACLAACSATSTPQQPAEAGADAATTGMGSSSGTSSGASSSGGSSGVGSSGGSSGASSSGGSSGASSSGGSGGSGGPDAAVDAMDAATEPSDASSADAGICAACGFQSVCVEEQTVGGAIVRPDDAGNCPAGYLVVPEAPLSCSPAPSFHCGRLPSICFTAGAAPAHCVCAPTLCSAGKMCTDLSPTLMQCLLRAP